MAIGAENVDSSCGLNFRLREVLRRATKLSAIVTGVKQGAGESKVTAYPNTFEDWGWRGCDWKLAGSWCMCYNENRDQRKTVWSLPNRDAPTHKASTKSADKKGRRLMSPKYTAGK
ncbi:hypothetical protein pdam_00016271 [Pocillopora damicornis]|uniref:Uncharacterized protein n=1 Tax=Pocillopora damicornis TaxID=46731 RepID=A0A3M6TAM7_POCDA|nr:hypothetical protein pdam_00016271 [Pocillopora damicornis]